jgi:hypothetical protein
MASTTCLWAGKRAMQMLANESVVTHTSSTVSMLLQEVLSNRVLHDVLGQLRGVSGACTLLLCAMVPYMCCGHQLCALTAALPHTGLTSLHVSEMSCHPAASPAALQSPATSSCQMAPCRYSAQHRPLAAAAAAAATAAEHQRFL